jgi:hypothetical protein
MHLMELIIQFCKVPLSFFVSKYSFLVFWMNVSRQKKTNTHAIKQYDSEGRIKTMLVSVGYLSLLQSGGCPSLLALCIHTP